MQTLYFQVADLFQLFEPGLSLGFLEAGLFFLQYRISSNMKFNINITAIISSSIAYLPGKSKAIQ
jgi:uncharacterized membrane protein YciS (DUF1049 family)